MSSETHGPPLRPERKGRRPYRKPLVEFIELRADQVLSNSCKTALSSGQGELPCSVTGCSSSDGTS